MNKINIYTYSPESRIDSLEMSVQLGLVGKGFGADNQLIRNTLADDHILLITLNRNHRTFLGGVAMRNRPDVLGAGPEMDRRSLGRDRATERAVGKHSKRWIVIEGGDDSSLSSSCI